MGNSNTISQLTLSTIAHTLDAALLTAIQFKGPRPAR